jgi:hypothetical protein
MCSNI